ncbi:MAG: 3-phosphoserine/phosphohydroxythreonine transaminase [Ruminococcaceae bacterium]|nr:3-phosphoserine/phosphohydroxythreonine transaminase [Oscillospiraceae bacterium]
MERVFNFSAGPAVMPLEVLEQAAAEMTNYNGTTMSVMEMSHRSKAYEPIIKDAEALLRELMAIPDNYKVLLLQGGAWTQFAAVPLNISTPEGKACFIDTGVWTNKASKEASLYTNVEITASSEADGYTYIPQVSKDMFSEDTDYLHICYNNTVYGTRYTKLPDCGDITLVGDLSSCILSENIDVSKFGVIFAGAQKNLGPAGVTVVIVREDLLGKHRSFTPSMLRYDIQAKNGSMFNTPPTYSIYMCKLCMEWVKRQGGVDAIQQLNERKSSMLYNYLDNSKLFFTKVRPDSRSMMNVTFFTGNEELDKKFVAEAQTAGLVNLKGYRTLGGMRASIYNAMPVAGVEKLVTFMEDFEKNNMN